MEIDMNIIDEYGNIGMDVQTGGGGTKKQIYKGPDEPTDPNILIWIDTSEEPVVKGRLLTADGEPFITVDGQNFLVAQTNDNQLRSIPINVNSIEENQVLDIEDYISAYTGTEIDARLALAYTAVQPSDISDFITKDVDDLTNYTLTSNLGDLATKDIVDYETEVTNKPTIPDELSDLADDSTHRLVTDTEKTTWNNKSDFSGSYNDLTDKPTIPTVPTNVSSFNNDAGYLTLATLPIYNGEVSSEVSL